MREHYQFAPGRFEARYWNSNGYGCAVIAWVTEGIDWAAYIGGCPPQSEEAGCRFVADYGAKLWEEDARYFFPELVELPYRL